MGYTIKWLEDNLGITRDMIRYYEDKELISSQKERNKTNYREYSEETINRIWSIKLLISIGFTIGEIISFEKNNNFNFYDILSKKVEQLEWKSKEILKCLEFAKTIKATGLIPYKTTTNGIKLSDFIEFSRNNWNAFDDPQGRKWMYAVDTLLSKTKENYDETDLKKVLSTFENVDEEQIQHAQTLAGYYRVIADMIHLGCKSKVVQSVVRCLYEYNLLMFSEYKDKYTPKLFAQHTIPLFMDSDLAKINERNYGEEKCLFIAESIAYFADYDFNEKKEKK